MEPALTKKLLLQRQRKQRISNEAVLMANELLRLFVVEARQRAALEVSLIIIIIGGSGYHSQPATDTHFSFI